MGDEGVMVSGVAGTRNDASELGGAGLGEAVGMDGEDIGTGRPPD